MKFLFFIIALSIFWNSTAQVSWHNFVFEHKVDFENIDSKAIKLNHVQGVKIYCSTESFGEYEKDRKRADKRFNLPRKFLQATVLFDTNGYPVFYHDSCDYYPGTIALSSDTVHFQDSIYTTFQYGPDGLLKSEKAFSNGKLEKHFSYKYNKNGLERKRTNTYWREYKEEYASWKSKHRYTKDNWIKRETEDFTIVERNSYKMLNDSTVFRIVKNGPAYLREYYLHKVDSMGNVISIYKLKEDENTVVRKSHKGLGGYPIAFYGYNQNGKMTRHVQFMNFGRDEQNWNHRDFVFSYNKNNQLVEKRTYEGWHSFSGRYQDDYREHPTESKLKDIETLFYHNNGLLINRTIEDLDFHIKYTWNYEYY